MLLITRYSKETLRTKCSTFGGKILKIIAHPLENSYS